MRMEGIRMEKKQTSVELLAKELESCGDSQFCEIEWKELDSLIEQAKELEKQQIIDAFLEGCSDNNNDGFEYYNEQFKSE